MEILSAVAVIVVSVVVVVVVPSHWPFSGLHDRCYTDDSIKGTSWKKITKLDEHNKRP